MEFIELNGFNSESEIKIHTFKQFFVEETVEKGLILR
jgi:hypothetical protein